MYQQGDSQTSGNVVGAQAELLLRRLQELERELATQEWWLLGRVLPEARSLAEVASLLAVARAELDGFLTQYCGRAPASSPVSDDAEDNAVEGDDPAQLERQRQAAVQLLQVLAAALPPTANFARQLRAFAERSGLPEAATDTLGIVTDRIVEAQEALQSGPS
jgi:hypothetical protein